MTSPRTRLRQVALVAADLAAAEREIESALGLSLCFRDPGVGEFGLHNALYPVGEQLLEVVSPTTDGTTAGRQLDRRGGDGGYMVIAQTDESLDDVRRRLDALDVRVVYEATVPGITGLHLHPRDVGGAILSIDRPDDWGEWPWAGPSWREHVDTSSVTAIRSVEIGADDPAAMCARWALVLARDIADGASSIDLDDGTSIRFVDAGQRGEGVDAIDLSATPGRPESTFTIAGCRISIT